MPAILFAPPLSRGKFAALVTVEPQPPAIAGAALITVEPGAEMGGAALISVEPARGDGEVIIVELMDARLNKARI